MGVQADLSLHWAQINIAVFPTKQLKCVQRLNIITETSLLHSTIQFYKIKIRSGKEKDLSAIVIKNKRSMKNVYTNIAAEEIRCVFDDI